VSATFLATGAEYNRVKDAIGLDFRESDLVVTIIAMKVELANIKGAKCLDVKI
jgi:hypothetical protein